MTTQFRTLFTVNISHAYYNEGCKDFDFVFPADTAQLLRNGKLIAKVRDGVLYVLFEADKSGNVLVSIAEKTLRIGLKLLNPFFSNYTDLAFNSSTLLYRNTGSPAVLDPPQPTTINSDPEFLQLGVSGIIEIKIDGGFYVAAPAFRIGFNAKQEQLKYYIVARNFNDTEIGQISVADNGFTEDMRPQVIFTKVFPAEFIADDIPPSLLGGIDTKVVLFKSQGMVARREKSRKKIQLNKNGEVLITHLPQPGAQSTNGNLFINISKP